jgi:hypothetical protein
MLAPETTQMQSITSYQVTASSICITSYPALTSSVLPGWTQIALVSNVMQQLLERGIILHSPVNAAAAFAGLTAIQAVWGDRVLR